MATDGDIQLLAEGTGPRVSTLEVKRPLAVDSSGNAQADRTVEQQLVTEANDRGDLVEDLAPQILGELRMIRELLEAMSLQLK